MYCPQSSLGQYGCHADIAPSGCSARDWVDSQHFYFWESALILECLECLNHHNGWIPLPGTTSILQMTLTDQQQWHIHKLALVLHVVGDAAAAATVWKIAHSAVEQTSLSCCASQSHPKECCCLQKCLITRATCGRPSLDLRFLSIDVSTNV